jgi:hypothetical protein
MCTYVLILSCMFCEFINTGKINSGRIFFFSRRSRSSVECIFLNLYFFSRVKAFSCWKGTANTKTTLIKNNHKLSNKYSEPSYEILLDSLRIFHSTNKNLKKHLFICMSRGYLPVLVKIHRLFCYISPLVFAGKFSIDSSPARLLEKI